MNLRAARVLLVLALAVLPAAPAAASGSTPTPTPTPTQTATVAPDVTPSGSAVGVSRADLDWLVAAHQAHLAAIAAGTDATRHAVNAAVDDLGAEMVEDHTEMDRELIALAEKYDVQLPDGMADDQRSALYDLLNRPSQSYDGAWVRWQLREHREARSAAATEVEVGTAADVVAAAREAQPVLRAHEQELERLAADLGVRTPSAVTGGSGGQAAAAASRALPVTVLVLLGTALIGADVLRRRRTRAAG